jgi:hypothetical protein
MKPPGPVDVRPLFQPLGAELVALLRALRPEDWSRRATPRWSVHEVAAHLLDTSVRRLSIGRDGHRPPAPETPIDGFDALVGFLNGLNADWARVSPRFSPRLLTDLLEACDGWIAAHFALIPLDAPALFPVDWAGVDGGTMWLDLGRELTERWHHQQQIRDAVGAPALDDPRWIGPVLAIAARALPRAWSGVAAPAGTLVQVTTPAASWCLRRDPPAWTLLEGRAPSPQATIETDAETAWRLWHRLLPREQAAARVTASGDPTLTAPFLGTCALMA